DIFVANDAKPNHLWINQRDGTFKEEAVKRNVAFNGAGGAEANMGIAIGDVDRDGLFDLFIPHLTEEKHRLWRQGPRGHFRDVSATNEPLCRVPMVARGLACGDIRNVGALDLLVTRVDGRAHLFRNAVASRGHWLTVRAVDSALRRDAYGAEVTVRAGDRRWVRWLNPGYSYLSSNDPRAHFGLGAAPRADAIAVAWPDGTEEEFP